MAAISDNRTEVGENKIYMHIRLRHTILLSLYQEKKNQLHKFVRYVVITIETTIKQNNLNDKIKREIEIYIYIYIHIRIIYKLNRFFDLIVLDFNELLYFTLDTNVSKNSLNNYQMFSNCS